MMNTIANKLSRHVLGMKFMRKTKQQVDKDKTEQTFRHHYSSADVKESERNTKPNLNSSSPSHSSSKTTCIIEEVGSYNQCEGQIFGRQSFGGFNPVLENNIRKGIWKPFYIDPDFSIQDDEEESKVKDEDDDGELDVSDEGMAKTFGSLVGTLGKRFMKKRDRHGVPLTSKKIKLDTDEMGNDAVDNVKGKNKKKKGWKNFFKGNKANKGNDQEEHLAAEGSSNNSNEPSTSNKRNQKNKKNNKRRQQESPEKPPANKKLKFMKPMDN